MPSEIIPGETAMSGRPILTVAAVVTALVASHATAVRADAFIGGLLGGFIGSAIGSQVGRQPAQRRVVSESPTRARTREVQTALNFFGWDVGMPDGAIGPRTRTGIAMYQAYLGHPPTGELTEFERLVLLTAYQRAQAGVPAVTQLAARHPDGFRGLLPEVRDELSGAGPTRLAEAPAAAPPPAAAAAAPAAAPAPAAPALPSFAGGAAAMQVSVASHCNRVALVTSASGGYVDIDTLRDPVFALNEQFCLARGYAIAEGEALIAQIPGLTVAQATEQCAGMATLLQPHVAALALQSQPEVTRGLAQFILSSGMAPADLTTTARVCLATGYMTENLTVALGSALLLHALGQTGYGEFPAHHLIQGLGLPQRRELAMEWFSVSVPQNPAAAPVGFAPGAPGRPALINAALAMLASGAQAPAATLPVVAPAAPAAPAAPLPAFNTRTTGN
jgi:peptidoglycan hydrolase-like protein with peptidoglycan-binding domain